MAQIETKKNSQNTQVNLQNRLMQTQDLAQNAGGSSAKNKPLGLILGGTLVIIILGGVIFYKQKSIQPAKLQPQPSPTVSPASQVPFSQSAVRQATKESPVTALKTLPLGNQNFPAELNFLIPAQAQGLSKTAAQYPGDKTGFEISFILSGNLYQEFLKYSNTLRNNPAWEPGTLAYTSNYGFLSGKIAEYSIQATFTQASSEISALVQAFKN